MSDGRPVVYFARRGAFLTLSRDAAGRVPLEPAEHELVTSGLQFRRRYHRAGRAAFVRGEYVPTVVELERLYEFDERTGVLVVPHGLLERLSRRYREAGYRTVLLDRTPFRDEYLKPRWKALEGAEFRPRQVDILETVARRVAARRGGLIAAVCGAGKSFLIEYYCALFSRAKIVVTSPSVDTVERLMGRLSPRFGETVIQVGGGRLSRSALRQARIIVSTADSLHHCTAPDALPDLTLVDEAHEYATDTRFPSVLALATRGVVMAMTATPSGRNDGTDARMEPMFGPTVFELGWAEAIELGLVVPIRVCWHDVDLDKNPVKDVQTYEARQRWGIWRNEGRNELIARVARRCPEEEQTLITVTHVEHALMLKAQLPEYHVVYALEEEERLEKLSRMRGLEEVACEAMTRDQRRRIRIGFEEGTVKKVIATSVWNRGVSFERLQSLIRADGQASAILDEQIPGRVCRRHDASGKQFGILHDFRDQFDGRFQESARKRHANYRAKGWEQIGESERRRRELAAKKTGSRG